jgi:hypothetical protein
VAALAGRPLRAFNAADVGHEIWNSGRRAADRLDSRIGFNHFTVPTIAGGAVFVGGESHLEVYGLSG